MAVPLGKKSGQIYAVYTSLFGKALAHQLNVMEIRIVGVMQLKGTTVCSAADGGVVFGLMVGFRVLLG